MRWNEGELMGLFDFLKRTRSGCQDRPTPGRVTRRHRVPPASPRSRKSISYSTHRSNGRRCPVTTTPVRVSHQRLPEQLIVTVTVLESPIQKKELRQVVDRLIEARLMQPESFQEVRPPPCPSTTVASRAKLKLGALGRTRETTFDSPGSFEPDGRRWLRSR